MVSPDRFAGLIKKESPVLLKGGKVERGLVLAPEVIVFFVFVIVLAFGIVFEIVLSMRVLVFLFIARC